MRRITLLVVLLTLPLALFSRIATPAYAATCNGLTVTIQGNDTAETLDGTPGDDVIDGAGGDDVIDGKGGNDTICGGFGDDMMIGGPGNDYMDGQGATTVNAVDYIDAPGAVVVSFGIQVTITADGTDTVRNFNKIRGGNSDDTITGFLQIFGAGGNDTLTGDDNRNTLSGGPGNDTLSGLGGADVLQPGSGTDIVNGGTTLGNTNQGGNADTIDFSDASGPITMANGRTTTTATGDGDDAVNSIETVLGSPFGDTFTNDDGLCILSYAGFGGDDTFEMSNNENCRSSVAPGAGNDIIDGDPGGVLSLGAGVELVYTDAPGPVNVNLVAGVATGEGTDTISRVSGVRGSKFNDVIVGDDRRNRNLFGDVGDDEIHGGGNIDQIIGGPGNDILDGGETLGIEDTGEPGQDIDILDYVEETFGAPRYSSAGAVNINLITGVASGDGNDTISGFESAEGSTFSDTITLADVVGSGAFGSTGDDTIIGGALADVINGGAGLDTITGNGGNDVIQGGGCFGPCGGGAGDTMNGGPGNDTITPSGGNDTIDGGADTDLLQFTTQANGGPTSGVTVNLTTGSLTGYGTSTIANIENVQGSEHDDMLIGDDGPNVLQSGFVNNTTDADTMQGNGGNDTLRPLGGDDIMDGGSDSDTLDYSTYFSGGLTIDLCAHTVTATEFDATVANVERVNGSGQADTITGCAGNEYLSGGSGDDVITSGGGTDTLDGGPFFTDTCNGDGDETYISCEVINSGCPGSDLDCDAVADASDNCVGTTNADQTNTDAQPIVTAGAPNDLSIPRDDAFGDACDPDDDNDGLVDAFEVAGCSGRAPTNPLVQDSDGDHVIDAAECTLGSDPNNAASKPPFPASGTDADGDGLTDDFESNSLGSNPNDVDSDDDGILDGIEFKGYGTFVTVANSDGDSCSDGREVTSLDGLSGVNSIDLQLVAQRFLRTDQPAHDVNKDGNINSLDLQLVAQHFAPTSC